MNLRNFAVASAAAVSLLASAGAASATTIWLSGYGQPNAYDPGSLIADFNQGANAPPVYAQNLYPTVDLNFSLNLGGATVGYQEGVSGYSGNLYNDPTTYLTVLPNTVATLQALGSKYLTGFSFYMGSPDWYNSIDIYGTLGGNAYHDTITGTQLTIGDVNQDWQWGKRVNLNFGAANITKIEFRSSQIAFEVDNFAAGVVPEPSSWALMILGFGGIGAAMRSRRKLAIA
jgi:hypothetical protein